MINLDPAPPGLAASPTGSRPRHAKDRTILTARRARFKPEATRIREENQSLEERLTDSEEISRLEAGKARCT
jgi:hypothetical protein